MRHIDPPGDGDPGVAHFTTLARPPASWRATPRRVLAALRAHPLALGLGLIFALSWPIDLAVAAETRGLLPFRVPFVVSLLVGYGVVAGALLATAIVQEGAGVRQLLRRYFRWRVAPHWYAVALLGFPALDLLALGLNVLFGGALPDFGKPYAYALIGQQLSLLVVVPAWFVFEVLTNGEEIGWRGYALPRLQARYGALGGTLLLAAIWAFWHAPKFLAAGPHVEPVWLFGLDTLAKAVLLTWVFNHTGGSLLLVTLFHASWNTAAISMPIMVAATGEVRPWAIAVGLATAAAIAVVVADVNLGRVSAASINTTSMPPVAQVDAPRSAARKWVNAR